LYGVADSLSYQARYAATRGHNDATSAETLYDLEAPDSTIAPRI